MSNRIMLIPVGSGVGLTSVSLGLVRAMEQRAVNVQFFKPVAQPRLGDTGPEKSSVIIRQYTNVDPAEPFSSNHAEKMIGEDNMDTLLEEIVARYEQHYSSDAVSVIEGLVSTRRYPYAVRLNYAVARALDAQIVFVSMPRTDSLDELNHKLEIAVDSYGGHKSKRLLGCIFNKVGAPLGRDGRIHTEIDGSVSQQDVQNIKEQLPTLPIFKKSFAFLGAVHWDIELVAPRVIDITNHMGAEFINKGDAEYRRLRSVSLCAREINNMTHVLQPGALLVMSGDRNDVFIAACLAALNGTKIGAILLTGGYKPSENVMTLCHQAMDSGLPVMLVKESTWQTSQLLSSFNPEVPVDDQQRIEKVMSHTADCIDVEWVRSLANNASRVNKLSPPAFRHFLIKKAREANKRIVLPEGNEPRTIKAAAICARRGLAKTVLLGDEQEIQRIAEQQGFELPEGIEIVSPDAVRANYIKPLVELRKHKGMTEPMAEEVLHDDTTLATMMLQQGDVDGLVSGAVNTTANTIRPALQLVKTAPDAKLVSSIFFMLLPDQVLVYGDCAINPDPNAEQLADIAIQSADSAAMFGIEPKVAMISYSTGDSGAGSDVEKVREATAIAQQRRPDLLLDGPMQYDAAVIESVAKKKAPNSPVAGQANVFIFPDLNTGNTTYKAVQRSFNLICIGPMLQGMNKPINDLSRGALVDDIVFTIALTAIQAANGA
ncbi:phosphate acetyltransferase [Alteromonas sp. 5E99-2]|uniref:phosphate acetyltransferase n=1 Tax=Alteromonas sp. 5E99-2 TaxID=2817683 RepID=UPI001A982D43|nr:phosphate acetyltransferase [Alteromonas sp. 5E99-2]MBO1254712.1 phosphate acetyltransferase [Alteromonas sp. 5E99-2]